MPEYFCRDGRLCLGSLCPAYQVAEAARRDAQKSTYRRSHANEEGKAAHEACRDDPNMCDYTSGIHNGYLNPT